jgi:peroxiredoxin
MRLVFLLGLILGFSDILAAEKTFSLKGEINNPSENRVLITVYRNWVQEPEDYYVYLDKRNRFSFEMALDEIAYVDFNYGLNGLLFQIIEPGDQLFLRFDDQNFYRTFQASGKGAEKWIYDYKQKERFEIKRDVEAEIIKLFGQSKDIFMKSVKAYEKEQLDYLNESRESFSEDFFVLKRADIIGKMNQLRLDFLSPKMKDASIFEAFDLSEVHPRLQTRSFEYGNFAENLCEVQMLNTGITGDTYDLMKVYLQIKLFFDNDWLSKPLTEKILATKLNSIFLIEGYSVAIESLVNDFRKFSDNPNSEYVKIINARFAVLKGKSVGQPVPYFAAEDEKGKYISLKEFSGNYVLLFFWASWCEPCLADMQAIPTVLNYFKGNKNLKVLQIAVDEKKDYVASVAARGKQIKNLRVDPGNNFLTSLDIKTLPDFVLIDKSGNWLETKLMEPGLDEGRGLIRQLETIFANQ